MITFGDYVGGYLNTRAHRRRGYFRKTFDLKRHFPQIAKHLDDKRITLFDKRGYHYLVTPYVVAGERPEYFILEVYTPDGHWDDRVPGFYDDIKDMECKVEDWAALRASRRKPTKKLIKI